MDIEKKNIVIATGGTGGHIFPSVSLSNFLNNEYEIDFITDKRGLKYLRTNKISFFINYLGNKSF